MIWLIWPGNLWCTYSSKLWTPPTSVLGCLGDDQRRMWHTQGIQSFSLQLGEPEAKIFFSGRLWEKCFGSNDGSGKMCGAQHEIKKTTREWFLGWNLNSLTFGRAKVDGNPHPKVMVCLFKNGTLAHFWKTNDSTVRFCVRFWDIRLNRNN